MTVEMDWMPGMIPMGCSVNSSRMNDIESEWVLIASPSST